MAITALIGLIWTSIETVTTRREITHQAAQERCKGATDSDCQSLVANLRGVAATEASADYTGQQLWLNLIGILGLGATILYARGAWLEARKSAGAARESTDAALRAFEADNRTWVTIQATGVSDLSVTNGKPRIKVDVELKNIGAQPAFDVHFAAKIFVARGMCIGQSARDGVIEYGQVLAEVPGYSGITLIGGQTDHTALASDAETDPEVEARVATMFSGFTVPPRPRVISAAYCVHYRSPGSEEWRCSAGAIMVSKTDHTDLPENGEVPKSQLRVMIIPSLTKMT